MDRNLPAVLCTEKSTKGCKAFDPDRKNDTWVRVQDGCWDPVEKVPGR